VIVYLGGNKLSLNPSKAIGSGGEADIFDIGGGLVLKVFKQPSHPDFTNMRIEQQIAEQRIREHQKKLPAFPKNLPSRVVSPLNLATNKNGSHILGYSMKFLKGYEVILKYADRLYRQSGVSDEEVVETFKDLHNTVAGIHGAGVVIGDFNDLNIMVKNSEAYIIDADSFQFGRFLCQVFTEKFVDPLLCSKNEQRPMLIRKYNSNSDWYAFAVMLMQSLLFVGPYGGVYKPKDKSKRIPHSARPLKRITVFDPEVKYPKPAIRYEVLPDDLLQYFHQLFIEDKRGEFPSYLLNEINWTKCQKCGAVHAKRVCPVCSYYTPSAVVETVRGNVICKRIFQTAGMIVFSTMQGGRLRYLYYDGKEFKREDNSVVIKGAIRPSMRFRIKSRGTIIGDGDRLFVLAPDGNTTKLAVDSAGTLSLFDANDQHLYWIDDGRLMRDDLLGPKYVGDVLSGRTLFWVGSDFGFGFYKAGNLNIGFVFDTNRSGINDSVKLPPMTGQLVDSTCYFAGNWCWFLYSMREKGITINRCVIVKSDGSVNQTAETREGDGSWLGSIRGKCAAGKFLLSATDEGIVKIEPDGNTLSVVKEFPDTEPFVDSGCHLFAGPSELFVVSRREIKTLRIS
jgi:tRNA A-37 threonylcarbamoyl transferase component Bud32/ribosomal protein L32